jgi:hypothetical protein
VSVYTDPLMSAAAQVYQAGSNSARAPREGTHGPGLGFPGLSPRPQVIKIDKLAYRFPPITGVQLDPARGTLGNRLSTTPYDLSTAMTRPGAPPLGSPKISILVCGSPWDSSPRGPLSPAFDRRARLGLRPSYPRVQVVCEGTCTAH